MHAASPVCSPVADWNWMMTLEVMGAIAATLAPSAAARLAFSASSRAFFAAGPLPDMAAGCRVRVSFADDRTDAASRLRCQAAKGVARVGKCDLGVGMLPWQQHCSRSGSSQAHGFMLAALFGDVVDAASPAVAEYQARRCGAEALVAAVGTSLRRSRTFQQAVRDACSSDVQVRRCMAARWHGRSCCCNNGKASDA